MEMAEILKQVHNGSEVMVTWALAITGGSIVAIVSTSYFRPAKESIRYLYLLFIPGWFLLAASIWFGDQVTRRCIAAAFTTDQDTLNNIGNMINQAYASQHSTLLIGLLFFGIWLVFFLIWWIFGDWTLEGRRK